MHGFGIDRDHLEIGTRGLVRLGRALLPIPQGAEGNLKARGKLLLRETEDAANDLCAWRPLHAFEVFGRERLRVGIALVRSMHFLLRHCVEATPIMLRAGSTRCLRGTCLFHKALCSSCRDYSDGAVTHGVGYVQESAIDHPYDVEALLATVMAIVLATDREDI